MSAYIITDGMIHKGQNIYYTTSKILADDLQELVFKSGSVADIKIRKQIGTKLKIGDKEYKRNYDCYVISERAKFNKFWFETGCRKEQYIKKEKYRGYVYDVTVPNHVIYVRRNGKPFWSSNCMRSGSPPSEIYTNMFENLAEIIWEGSKGNCIDPVIKHKYGVELLIHSNWAMENWQAITFPEKYKDNYKFRNLCFINGKYYVVPSIIPVPEIGAIVATDDTLEGAVEQIKMLSEQIESYDIMVFPDVIETATEEINKLKELGMEF